MKRATLTEAKNTFSALVDQVRGGETIIILDRGIPVARLESVLEAQGDAEGKLSRLERQGVLRRGGRRLSSKVVTEKPPRPKRGSSALEALLEERRSSR